MNDISDDLTLYHWPHSRGTIVRWMLEEIGVPYRLELIDLSKGDQLKPDFLALNPMGKVPLVRHGTMLISEVGAICCYLADRFPAAGLAPAIEDPLRGPYLKWLFFGPSCIEPAVIHKAMQWPEGRRGMLGWGSYDEAIAVLNDGVANARPWLLGERFTAADVVIGAQVRWGIAFGTIAATPMLSAYADRLAERPALKRQLAADAALIEAQATARAN